MSRRIILFFAFAFLINATALLQAQDRIRLKSGSQSGEILGSTRNEVTISKGSTGNKTIPVNQIRSVIFKKEPNALTQARVNANNGGYQNALDRLQEIDAAEVERKIIQQEIDFYKAYCSAKLAVGGAGDIRIAGRQLMKHLQKNWDDFHYYDSVELLGDLFVAAKLYENAEKQYSELAKAPWLDYQARALLLVGRALADQGKHTEAIEQFDSVLQLANNGKEGETERLAATVGKALSLTETGQLSEGVTMIEEVIRDADPEDAELHAMAYNAKGKCHQKAGQTKAAVLAYLHVDVLYSNVSEAHAEAITQLVPLWQSLGEESRAREAQQQLRDKYGRE